jgi:hypothetical protein
MDENKFKCVICSKYYKSYKSLWNHKKLYHTEKPTINQQKPTFVDKPSSKNPQKPTNEIHAKKNKLDMTECIYCNKKLSCYNSMNRHKQKCKLRDYDIAKEEMKKEIADLREMVAELIKNKSNITNNNGTTNNNNGTTNNNNGTINNNYITIVPFGKEKFVEVTSEKEHLFLLKQNGNNVLYKCIEMKHFNEKYPQYHNYMRTNNRTNEAKIYDDSIKDFKTVKCNEIVDEVIMNAEYDIDDMYNLHENKINENERSNVRRIIDENRTPEYVEEHVNLMAYDNRNKVMETHKKNRKNKSIE